VILAKDRGYDKRECVQNYNYLPRDKNSKKEMFKRRMCQRKREE